MVTLEIMPVAQEPEPEIPSDLHEALAAIPEARAVWDDTTTIARLDWIHWITSARQSKTRAKERGFKIKPVLALHRFAIKLLLLNDK